MLQYNIQIFYIHFRVYFYSQGKAIDVVFRMIKNDANWRNAIDFKWHRQVSTHLQKYMCNAFKLFKEAPNLEEKSFMRVLT
jgi:hypothetical protein